MDGIYQYMGIPYAKAPLGELRFAPPQPFDRWEGVYDATFHRPIPPQVPSNLDEPMGAVDREQSEDCLTLTVSTPNPEGKLPVAVWFHGGANVCGAGSLDWYDGKALAQRGNMVVVGVNFRLGALGFLVHPAVNEENLSILDQIFALRWVQDNISRFGGDPGNVTVFGQSAGANAIIHMVSLPETEGLFHKLILQSPSIGRANYTKEEAREIAEKLISLLGIDLANAGETEIRRLLQKKTAQEILEATDRCAEHFADKYPGMLFKPVRDDWNTAQATIAAAVKEATRRRLPLIIGTTRDEMHAFSLDRDADSEQRSRAVQLQRYDGPAIDFANQTSAGGCPVWKYRFEWSAPDSLYDACHCIELPFVFGGLGAWENAPFLAGAANAELEQLTGTIQPLWCDFITTGRLDPAVWPQYNRVGAQHKIFNNRGNEVRAIRF